MWFVVQAVPVLATFCGIVYCLLAIRAAAKFLSRKEFAQSVFAPPVSILKPLCYPDPHGYDSLRSHCVQDYPQYEIIFGIASPRDPVISTVERLIREFPDVSIKLVMCPRAAGANFKVSSLVQMLPSARYEYVLINDSDIFVPPDYLRRVIGVLEDPAVGMVTCLYRGAGASTLGSRLESAGIASDFVPGVLCAIYLDGAIRFAMGSTMAFPRRSLTAAGGLESIADYLADDFELGHRLAKAGLRVEIADCIVDHYLPAYSLFGFWQHQLRWARTIRSSRPGGYAGLVITYVVPWSLISLIVSNGAVWGWLLFAVAFVLRSVVAAASGLKVLHDRRTLYDLWLLPLRDFIALAIWVWSYTGRHVVWRGERFEVVEGKLRSVRQSG